jgi:hypothetical protein
MRKLALLLLLLVLPIAACKHGGPGVKGSGKTEVQKRQISNFSSISTEGAYTVEVVCQKDLSLEIEGDDNILPLITTDVSSGVLRISNSKGYSVATPIVVRITVPNLEVLSVSGAGKFDISKLKTEKFAIDANGAAQIKVSGTTNFLNIHTNGAGKIDTYSLEASRAVVESNGVSKVDVDVSDHLDVTISGPSKVTYKGDPTINKTIHGPGKLEKRASEGA